ncbi:glycoside hydrolase family 32 protein [Herbiconiux sp. P17]|uniref:glycoside hydrolase family 32 protein n=1 Tax=Herbiconiux wuyangfengii TaxID=3342794 RepID=UPI0035B8165C
MTDAQRPRPHLHFTPRSGWINDPLALTWHNGQYHLFFQFVPDRTTWAPDCRWGHATSPDLVTWTELPPALEPGHGDGGIWSGSMAIDDDGRPTIFYTSVQVPAFSVGSIRTATPVDDDWLVWTKGEVVVHAPPLDLVAFRDPFVLRDRDRWRMLVGTALVGGEAAASSFVSDDLAEWSYEGLAASRNTRETEPVWTGSLWECPQIFTIDGRDVMVTSVWQDDELYYVVYAIGVFKDGRFEPEHWGRLTYGESYYAPSFFRDEAGQPCLIFWMRGVLDEVAGRASALSVPHVLRLDGDTLVSTPHPSVIASLEVHSDGMDQHRPTLITLDSDQEWTTTNDAGTVRVRRTAESVVCTWMDTTTVVPSSSDPVTVVVDEETVEVFTGAAVFGIGATSRFDSSPQFELEDLHPARLAVD